MTKKPVLLVIVLSTVVFLVSGCGMIKQMMGLSSYGEKIEFGTSGEEVYYKGDVSEEEARRLGQFLVNTEYFNNQGAKTVQLVREDGKIQVRFVVKDGVWNNTTQVNMFKDYGSQISGEVFAGNPIELHLCDVNLNTQKAFQLSGSSSDSKGLKGKQKHNQPDTGYKDKGGRGDTKGEHKAKRPQ
jgi:hypothetical protein